MSRRTKLEVDNLRESSLHLKEAFWMKDSDVSECFQCESVFTLSKRKVSARAAAVGLRFDVRLLAASL